MQFSKEYFFTSSLVNVIYCHFSTRSQKWHTLSGVEFYFCNQWGGFRAISQQCVKSWWCLDKRFAASAAMVEALSWFQPVVLGILLKLMEWCTQKSTVRFWSTMQYHLKSFWQTEASCFTMAVWDHFDRERNERQTTSIEELWMSFKKEYLNI